MLVQHVPTKLPHDLEAVEGSLAAALGDVAHCWPTVQLAPEAFVPWIASRIPADAPSVEAGLARLRLTDLYIACACATGDRTAIGVFDATFIATAPRASEDVKQALREKLFVAEPGRRPRIVDYAGRGDLRRWVRAVAARMEIDAQRRVRETPVDAALLEALVEPGPSPQLAQLKKESRS